MSPNILGLTAAVWAITACDSESTFSTALQQGQVTSKVCGRFAMLRNDTAIGSSLAGLQLDRENMENIQHLQPQQNH